MQLLCGVIANKDQPYIDGATPMVIAAQVAMRLLCGNCVEQVPTEIRPELMAQLQCISQLSEVIG